MSRRRSSTARDLLELAAALPWWLGLLLAALSYLLFSALAAQPLLVGGTLNLLSMVGTVLRIVVPIVFIVGAVMSAASRAERQHLLASASSGDARSALAQMTWREFEMLLGEFYRQQGHAVAELGGRGADGGVDLVLRKDGRKTLVQCKHWKAFSVGVPTVRELLGAMTANGADAGQVVTSGRFTQQAREFAAGQAITLIDGPQLESMLNAARQARGTPTEHGALTLVERVDNPPERARPVSAPACPRCGAAMVNRVARKGPSAGGAFWGCSAFPQCKGTRPAAP